MLHIESLASRDTKNTKLRTHLTITAKKLQ